MANSASTISSDAALVAAILRRVSADLGMMLGQALAIGAERVERARTRPAGAGLVHISFKLGFVAGDLLRHGALLVPLSEAITMACLLLMIPEEATVARRADPAPDGPLKDAMLEIGSMIGGATSTALAEHGLAGWSARSEGCQGVRPGVRPAFPYEEGSELVVARAAAEIEGFPAFELLLVLPSFE